MSRFDYIYIAGFFVFSLVIGAVFKRHTKNTSDYFRGGGAMTWWMCGASAFVQGFSAWSFVGLAGAIYSRGSIMAWVFIAQLFGYSICAAFTAGRFRRLRVIVWVEALRQRYGIKTEQFYAYFNMIFGVLHGGIGLYILSVFMSSVFGISVGLSITVLGAVITVMAATGGSWATTASDFVQSLVIVAILVVTAILTLSHPDVGGIGGFLQQIPATHWTWGFDVSNNVLTLWIIVFFMNQIFSANSLSTTAARLIVVKDEASARKAMYIPLVGFLVFPLITFIPPLAATFLFPDINELYPQLNHAKEASYAAVALMVLPKGMIGLLVCAMFAASTTSLDSALNRNSGVFTRNIYMQLIRPACGEKEAIIVARLTTFVMGIITIFIGFQFAEYKDLPIFELTNLIGSLLGQPMLIPLVLALFVKRVPTWAASSTVVVGLLVSFLTMKVLPIKEWFMSLNPEYTAQDVSDITWLIPNLLVTVSTVSWFFSTRMFYKGPSKDPVQAKAVEQFFENQITPIDLAAEGIVESDGEQARTMGRLSTTYGLFILSGALIPNPLLGRSMFALAGGGILVIGWLLRRAGRKNRRIE